MNTDNAIKGPHKQINIEICMGSSCFARGNGEHVKMIQSYIHRFNGMVNLNLKGSLCQNRCSNGPSLSINGKIYTQIDSTSLKDLLDHHLKNNSHE